MILLSSAFRIDNAQNMDRTNVSPTTSSSSTTHHSATTTTSTTTATTTATWLNLWSDIATWISRKPRHQVDPMFPNTHHHHGDHHHHHHHHHSQEDVLLGPVSEFQKVYVSFPEFKETEQTNNNIESTTLP